MPLVEQACNTQACQAVWNPGTWSEVRCHIYKHDQIRVRFCKHKSDASQNLTFNGKVYKERFWDNDLGYEKNRYANRQKYILL